MCALESKSSEREGSATWSTPVDPGAAFLHASCWLTQPREARLKVAQGMTLHRWQLARTAFELQAEKRFVFFFHGFFFCFHNSHADFPVRHDLRAEPIFLFYVFSHV